MSAYYNPVF